MKKLPAKYFLLLGWQFFFSLLATSQQEHFEFQVLMHDHNSAVVIFEMFKSKIYALKSHRFPSRDFGNDESSIFYLN